MDFGTDRSPGNNPHQILRDDCILNQLSQTKGGVKRFLKKKKKINGLNNHGLNVCAATLSKFMLKF